MSNATISSIGQVNSAGTADALFLKVFSNEVLTQFIRENQMLGMSTVRTLGQGAKSSAFPVTGFVNASYHTAGNEITGQAIKHNEKIISLDDMLLADVFVAEVEELKSAYDVRAEYSRQMGSALANKVDKHLLSLAILASRVSTPNVTGGNVGSEITDADCHTNATSLIDSVFEAIQKLDENNVPSDGRVCIVRPDQYYQLANVDKLVNRDFSRDNGDFGKGTVLSIGGVPIVKSNTAQEVFATDLSSAISGTNNTYNGDFTHTFAVVMHNSAIGTIKRKDLVMESTYDARRIGTLMTARMLMGSNILRPESCVSIKKA
jgi:N4-gp56 family major capsid protein